MAAKTHDIYEFSPYTVKIAKFPSSVAYHNGCTSGQGTTDKTKVIWSSHEETDCTDSCYCCTRRCLCNGFDNRLAEIVKNNPDTVVRFEGQVTDDSSHTFNVSKWEKTTTTTVQKDELGNTTTRTEERTTTR